MACLLGHAIFVDGIGHTACENYISSLDRASTMVFQSVCPCPLSSIPARTEMTCSTPCNACGTTGARGVAITSLTLRYSGASLHNHSQNDVTERGSINRSHAPALINLAIKDAYGVVLRSYAYIGLGATLRIPAKELGFGRFPASLTFVVVDSNTRSVSWSSDGPLDTCTGDVCTTISTSCTSAINIGDIFGVLEIYGFRNNQGTDENGCECVPVAPPQSTPCMCRVPTPQFVTPKCLEHEVEILEKNPADSFVRCQGKKWSGKGLRLTQWNTNGNLATFPEGQRYSVFREYLSGMSIPSCPNLDLNVGRGLDKPDCGLHPDGYYCDYWDLSAACIGEAAVPGSNEMAGVCRSLCNRTQGCKGYILDNSINVNTGRCIPVSETSQLSSSCFFESGDIESHRTDIGVCETRCAACDDPSDTFASLEFEWRANDDLSQVDVNIHKSVSSRRGALSHGQRVRFDSTRSKGHKKKLKINAGDNQVARMSLGCQSGVFLGQRILLSQGYLVLVGFQTTSGASDFDRCNAPQFEYEGCRVCGPTKRRKLLSLSFKWSPISRSTVSVSSPNTIADVNRVLENKVVTLTYDPDIGKGRFGKRTVISVNYNESITIDTSCTVTLVLGDKFWFSQGTLELVGFSTPNGHEIDQCDDRLCVRSGQSYQVDNNKNLESSAFLTDLMVSTGVVIVLAVVSAFVAMKFRMKNRTGSNDMQMTTSTSDLSSQYTISSATTSQAKSLARTASALTENTFQWDQCGTPGASENFYEQTKGSVPLSTGVISIT